MLVVLRVNNPPFQWGIFFGPAAGSFIIFSCVALLYIGIWRQLLPKRRSKRIAVGQATTTVRNNIKLCRRHI